MYFGSLLMSFESIRDFTKKIQSLLSLIASVVFNNSIEVETIFIGLLNEIREVGRVLTKK